jgi:hypothetical protein
LSFDGGKDMSVGKRPARRGEVVLRHEMNQLAVEAPHAARERAAQPDGVRDDHIEYWLEIGGRTGDNAQDLTSCRLLLKRLAQLAAARLEFALVAAPPGSQQVNKALPHCGTSTNGRLFDRETSASAYSGQQDNCFGSCDPDREWAWRRP